jgi:adenine phosphoribosyltransferase
MESYFEFNQSKRRESIKSLIGNIIDYPSKGIIFRNITPLLNNKLGLKILWNELNEVEMYYLSKLNFNKIVAIESRGFIFGSLLAQISNCPLVLARKPGKLPGEVLQKKYSLEYGEDALCIQLSDIQKDDNVLVVDDLLATGGTAKVVCDIIETLGGNVAGCYFLTELNSLNGRNLLEKSDIKVISSLHYE